MRLFNAIITSIPEMEQFLLLGACVENQSFGSSNSTLKMKNTRENEHHEKAAARKW